MAMFLVFVGALGVLCDLSAAEIILVQFLCIVGHGVGCLANMWWRSALEGWRPGR